MLVMCGKTKHRRPNELNHVFLYCPDLGCLPGSSFFCRFICKEVDKNKGFSNSIREKSASPSTSEIKRLIRSVLNDFISVQHPSCLQLT